MFFTDLLILIFEIIFKSNLTVLISVLLIIFELILID